MGPFFILILLCFQAFFEAFLVHGNVGTAVAYGPPYTPTKCGGYSQYQFPASNMFAAVSPGLWDNGAACGRTYRMVCLSGTNRPCKREIIDVQVVDLCSSTPCPANILLSRDAFSAISSISNAIINIEYIQIDERNFCLESSLCRIG